MNPPDVRLAYHPQGGPSLTEDPTVRLAYNPGPVNAYGALAAPTVRLATNDHERLDATLTAAPTVRLALANSPAERNGTSGFDVAQDARAPALLVSYVYLDPFLKHRHRYHFRDWVLDSGAFSAHHSGTTIALADYIACCQHHLSTDPRCTEVYSLDVISDWRASVVNCEAMWIAGVPAIPTYHHGEPESLLKDLAAQYPKIALGGAVGLKPTYKLHWAEQCFARVWPTRVHGFGFGAPTHILALPWHSVDATNWESGPCKFGQWRRYGHMSVRGSAQNLRAEVEEYLRIEAQARVKWAKEMAVLDARAAPTVRLALAPQREATQASRFGQALGGQP
jgi:hypothetical protein